MSKTEVRSEQVKDDSIVDADIAAWAAIAESKLALDFSTQRLMVNISKLHFKVDALHTSTRNQVDDIAIDVFSDATGIDADASTDEYWRGTPNYDVVIAPGGAAFEVDTSGTLASSLVSYWPMDELEGARYDIIGSNHLPNRNGTIGRAEGKSGNSALLVASGSRYFGDTDIATLDMGDEDFTVACWVYIVSKGATDSKGFITKSNGNSSSAGYSLVFNPIADRFQFQVGNGSSGAIVSANNLGSPSTATWYFVIGWYDSTANTVNIQVNNGTADSTSQTVGSAANSVVFCIGSLNDGQASTFFDGRIEEAAIWRKVLTSTEKTDLYNSGAGNTVKSTSFAPDAGKQLNYKLISYWKFPNSNSFQDYVYSNHLTGNGGATTFADGKVGESLSLTSASSQYLNISRNASLDTGDIDFTIACWVYLTSTSSNMYIAAKGDGNGNVEWSLDYTTSTNRFRFSTQSTSVEANNFGAPSSGTWYFIVAWHDAAASTMNIQVDNGTANSVSEGANSPNLYNSSGTFVIGAYPASGGSYSTFWNGRIDEFGFWKRTLTSQERSDLYNSGTGNTAGVRFLLDTDTSLHTSLKGYWTMDGDGRDTWGGHNLTANGGVDAGGGRGIGVHGGAWVFDGTDDYGSLTENADVSADTDQILTVAFWMRLESTGTNRGILGKADTLNASQEWGFEISAANQVSFFIRNATDGLVIAQDTGVTLSAGTWYFIMGYHDPTNNVIGISVNNNTPTTTAVSNGIQATTTAFRVGHPMKAPSYFHGRIDGVGIWKKLLSTQEKTDLYNSGAGNHNGMEIAYNQAITSADVRSIAYTAEVAPSKAMIVADETLGSGSITYYASRDNGTTWTQVTNEVLTSISSQPSGTQLKWRAVITGNAELDNIALLWKT